MTSRWVIQCGSIGNPVPKLWECIPCREAEGKPPIVAALHNADIEDAYWIYFPYDVIQWLVRRTLRGCCRSRLALVQLCQDEWFTSKSDVVWCLNLKRWELYLNTGSWYPEKKK